MDAQTAREIMNCQRIIEVLKLELRRAGTEIAGVDETWTVSVPDAAEAANHLILYYNDERTVTANLYTEFGTWRGGGRAGQGNVQHSFR